MVYFTTKAYNAEKTIRRAVESILSQTYGDFKYHLCDNGSTDGTGEIIAEYAQSDKRIVAFYNTSNMQWNEGSQTHIVNMARYLHADDWLSVLDADDNYEPLFLEEMLKFGVKHRMDYVACRSNHIREPSGNIANEFVLDKDIVICRENFGKLFPDYFRFMGARWAKIQKGTLFHRINWKQFDKWISDLNLSHRHDTAAMLYYLCHSEKAGVLAKPLHNYRLYTTSHSTQNIESKHSDNLKMPNIYREFLIKKVGYVSEKNEKFIDEVFWRSEMRTNEQGRQR